MCAILHLKRQGLILCSIVFAFDPTDSDPYVLPIGKQALRPSHIFYRPCSGIWQSVWIESAPTNYISDLSIDAGADGRVNLTVDATGSSNSSVEIAVYEKVSLRYCTQSGSLFADLHRDPKSLWLRTTALAVHQSLSRSSHRRRGLQTRRVFTM